MKKQIILSISILLFLLGCTPSNTKLVNEFVKAVNSHDIATLKDILSDDFIFKDSYSPDYNKDSVLNHHRNPDPEGYIRRIIRLTDSMDVITTKEEINSYMDSMLNVTPKYTVLNHYTFSKGKISSIVVDTVLNYNDYKIGWDRNIRAYFYFLEYVLSIPIETINENSYKQYLTEYTKLSENDRQEIFKYSQVQGEYVSKNSRYYRKLKFKGKSTVVVVDAIFGNSYPTSYVLDGKYIRISSDQSDLLFEIVDNNTLIGEGFAEGVYRKTK